MKFVDYYKILGINSNVSKEEIKQAYRKCAYEYHPDKQIGKNLSKEEIKSKENIFKEVVVAYGILSNEEKRREYDRIYRTHYGRLEKQLQEKQEENQKRSQKFDFEKSDREEAQAKEERRRQRAETERRKKFAYKVRKAYQEVRKDEQKNTFYNRHKRMNQFVYEQFKETKDTIPNEIIFHIEQGTIHIFGEAIYQLAKLRYIADDTVPKFIIRNRRLITTLALGVILTNSFGGKSVETFGNDFIDDVEINITPEDFLENNQEEVYRSTIQLNRKYLVVAGDTLSQLALDSGNSMATIKKQNNFTTDYLYIGDVLNVPYTVNNEDLQYYTESIYVKNKSIYEIAREYETDISTLVYLNEEAIQKVDDAYVILSERLLVPNFITKSELQEIKDNNQFIRAN